MYYVYILYTKTSMLSNYYYMNAYTKSVRMAVRKAAGRSIEKYIRSLDVLYTINI